MKDNSKCITISLSTSICIGIETKCYLYSAIYYTTIYLLLILAIYWSVGFVMLSTKNPFLVGFVDQLFEPTQPGRFYWEASTTWSKTILKVESVRSFVCCFSFVFWISIKLPWGGPSASPIAHLITNVFFFASWLRYLHCIYLNAFLVFHVLWTI